MSEKKESIIQAIKYTIISSSAGLIQAGSFTLFETILKLNLGTITLFNRIFNLDYVFNSAVALILSVLWNFTINRKVTFKSSNNIPIAMLKVALFYVIFLPVTTIAGGILTGTFHWNSFIVEGLTMILNFILEFIYFKYYVFKETTKKA